MTTHRPKALVFERPPLPLALLTCAVVIVGGAAAANSALAQSPTAPGADQTGAGVSIGSGVFVVPDTGRIVTTEPSGALTALNLQGQVQWQRRAGGRLIGVAQGRAVLRGDPTAASNEVSLFSLNLETGRPEGDAVQIALPQAVRLGTGTGREDALRLSLSGGGNATRVQWSYTAPYARGIAPDVQRGMALSGAPSRPGEEDNGAQAQDSTPALRLTTRLSQGPASLGGTLSVDLSSGRILPPLPDTKARALARRAAAQQADRLGRRRLSRPPQAPRPGTALWYDQRLAGFVGMQFLSSDGRHVLVSRRDGGIRRDDPYRWSIVDRETEEVVGTMRSGGSVALFAVVDGVLLHVSGAQAGGTGAKLITLPRRVLARALEGGQVLWSRAIEDRTLPRPLPH